MQKRISAIIIAVIALTGVVISSCNDENEELNKINSIKKVASEPSNPMLCGEFFMPYTCTRVCKQYSNYHCHYRGTVGNCLPEVPIIGRRMLDKISNFYSSIEIGQSINFVRRNFEDLSELFDRELLLNLVDGRMVVTADMNSTKYHFIFRDSRSQDVIAVYPFVYME